MDTKEDVGTGSLDTTRPGFSSGFSTLVLVFLVEPGDGTLFYTGSLVEAETGQSTSEKVGTFPGSLSFPVPRPS